MSFKELKQRFIEKDEDFSSRFYKIDKISGAKRISWSKVILVWILAIFLSSLIAGVLVSPFSYINDNPNLVLSESYASVDAQQTTYLLKGHVNPNSTVFLNSNELKLNNAPVNVDSDGNFTYSLNLPKDLENAKVTVLATFNNKTETKPLEISRKIDYTPSTSYDSSSYDSSSSSNSDIALSNYDLNGDGKISSYEWGVCAGDAGFTSDDTETLAYGFNLYDSDSDGYLDSGELDSFLNDNY